MACFIEVSSFCFFFKQVFVRTQNLYSQYNFQSFCSVLKQATIFGGKSNIAFFSDKNCDLKCLFVGLCNLAKNEVIKYQYDYIIIIINECYK